MTTFINKIITKSPNRSFQVRRAGKTTAEQEKALRDQLHAEIENKSKACSNPTYDCSIPRIEGYEYCIRHILLDPRAPYKQCAYLYSNGKRCLQAAPKYEGRKDVGLTNFCFEHNGLVQLTKTRTVIGKYKQVESNEAYLNELTHHINIDKYRNENSTQPSEPDEEIDVVTSNVEPLSKFLNRTYNTSNLVNHVHIADFDKLVKKGASNKKSTLDYASDSPSDDEVTTLTNTWKGHEWDNSDNESVDSQDEDLLKHAGIYTTEEATMITKQKMERLQSLYMGQILRLQHLLKEKRRNYLQTIRKERETLCSVHDQPKDTPQERRLYEKLKALNHYHRKSGVEAVLHKKFQEKRLKSVEGAGHKPTYTKCIFTEGGVKCGERALPCCKYCKKHILEDKKQILFRACGVEKSGIICQEPVPNIFESSTCVLHIKMPAQRNYTQKKFESETEEEEEEINHRKEDNKEDANEIEDAIPEQKKTAEMETIEILPVDDIANNVTIAHDQQIVYEEKASEKQNAPEMEEGEIVFQITTTEIDQSHIPGN